jgi:hypothetical protein
LKSCNPIFHWWFVDIYTSTIKIICITAVNFIELLVKTVTYGLSIFSLSQKKWKCPIILLVMYQDYSNEDVYF